MNSPRTEVSQTGLAPDVERLAFLLHNIPRLVRKRFEGRGNQLGLSVAQWRLLSWLLKEEGATQARLAELLEIEPISVSRLIDRMAESGWVERRQGVRDRRVRKVFATDKAREAYKQIKTLAGGIYEEALAGLDSSERAALIGALEKMAENLADGDAACGASGAKAAGKVVSR